MVIHRYQAIDDSGSEQEANPQEFLVNQPYKCEVIVTNVSPKEQAIDLTFAIPMGSMPLGLSKNMKSQTMSLRSYKTEIRSFDFYFPVIGVFKHFPSNVSKDSLVIAKGAVNKLSVVKELKQAKKETFQDLLKTCDLDEILRFL